MLILVGPVLDPEISTCPDVEVIRFLPVVLVLVILFDVRPIPPELPSVLMSIPPVVVSLFFISIPLLFELVVINSTNPVDDPIVFVPEFVKKRPVPVPNERTDVLPPKSAVIRLPPPPVAVI
jgi:hypothetical protein